MRKKVRSITLLAGILSILVTNVSSAEGNYNPQEAVNYAEQWCNGRNSSEPDNCDPYKNYGDYDCANFVSQCLIAGGLDLSVHPGADSCGSIPTCTNLHDYLVSSNYLGATWETRLKGQGEPLWFVPGDPAIFGYSDAHPRTHAVFAVTGDATHYATCNAHSTNQYHRTIQWFFDYSVLYDPNPFDRCTFYHIPVSGAEEPVYFTDDSLKTAVEYKLGKTDPTPTDMLGLTYLHASSLDAPPPYLGGPITDLTGLEYATNLRELDMWIIGVRSISALASLTLLKEVNLMGNEISDISALSGLTNLTNLSLGSNQISDISALSDLTNLTRLILGNNQISDISALSGMTNLTSLSLYSNQISDISALSGLTNLTSLGLRGNPLNEDAYNIYIPQIRENNPGIDLRYDPPVDHVLTVSKTGSGTIISSPAGINCGSDCSESYEAGTEVTLTATADDGWIVTDWDFENADITECQLCELEVLRNFDYNISVSCTVTMYRSIDAHITFERGGVIKVTKTGSGTVVSSPGGINCGCDCSAVFMGDSRIVTLTAIPAIGSTFLGWEGDCSGTGPCVLDTSRHRNVTANFTQGGQFMLTVSKTGSGTIISSPSGINCGSDCSESYEDGTEVTLTIEADSGWAITGAEFSGSCNMTAKQLLELAFFRPPPLSVYSLPLDIVETETIAITFSPVGGEPPEPPPGTTLSGIVFDDKNDNRTYNPGEEVSGALISTGEGTPVTSGPNGRYIISELTPTDVWLQVTIDGDDYWAYSHIDEGENQFDIMINSSAVEQFNVCSADVACLTGFTGLLPYVGKLADPFSIAIGMCATQQRFDAGDVVGGTVGVSKVAVDLLNSLIEDAVFIITGSAAEAPYQIVDAAIAVVMCVESQLYESLDDHCGGYSSCLWEGFKWLGESIVGIFTGSPVDIRVIDSQGNVMELDANGYTNNELSSPGWIFKGPDDKELALIFDADDDYTVLIVGRPEAGASSTFYLQMMQQSAGGSQQIHTYTNVSISAQGVAFAQIDDNPVLEVDVDGDGTVDLNLLPDSLAMQVVPLLPSSDKNKAGRTMPVKFSLRKPERVDPAMPFVYDEDLEIRIYDSANPDTILQTSRNGDTARDYRIDTADELYITNFRTKKEPAEYVVEIWRTDLAFQVGSFTFQTLK